jgi:hypothetical protein
MKIIASLLLSLVITIVVYTLFMTFIFKLNLTDHLSTAFPVLFGLQGGFFAASYFVIIPFFINAFSNYNIKKDSNSSYKSMKEPIKTAGEVRLIEKNNENYNINIFYAGVLKEFKKIDIDKSFIFSNGDSITVHYNPTNKQESYLDPYDQTGNMSIDHDTTPSFDQKKYNTVFKLLELNPIFHNKENMFELTGEVHGGKLSGQKVSLTEKINKNDLSKLIPGKVFPCHIHENGNELSISLEII